MQRPATWAAAVSVLTHTQSAVACDSRETSDRLLVFASDFCKKNMSSANPQRRSLAPTVTDLWLTRTADGGCEIVSHATLPLEASTNAGAPKSIVCPHAIRRCL